MSQRTTISLVRGVLGDDFAVKVDRTVPDLQPFIDAASNLVDTVVAYALSYKDITLPASTAELVERWLAAHMYKQAWDKVLTTKSSGGASGGFAGQTTVGMDSTLYGQNAQRLDYSGVLRNLDKQQMAGAAWLGKDMTEQLTYDERN